MQISRILFKKMVSLFSLNTATLNPGIGNELKIKFINIPFTERPTLVMADLAFQNTELLYSSINITDAAPVNYTQPQSDQQVAKWFPEIVPFFIETDVVATNFTIFGTAVMSNDESVLYGVKALPDPITFSAAGQGADVPPLEFKFPPAMVR